MEITYGHRVTSESDLFVHLAERATAETVKAGRYVITIFRLSRKTPLEICRQSRTNACGFFPHMYVVAYKMLWRGS